MGIMMIHRLSSLMLLLSASMGMLTLGFGCNAPNFDPKLATRPYPFDLHTTDVVPIQVFRDGTTIEIVNSTDRTWSDATIWVNQRYAAPLKSLQPGQRVSMDLFSFRDDIGEQFRGRWTVQDASCGQGRTHRDPGSRGHAHDRDDLNHDRRERIEPEALRVCRPGGFRVRSVE